MQQHHVQPEATPPVNGYSHAVSFDGRMVAVSGQLPLDGKGRLFGADDPQAQVRQVFENLTAVLAAAGAEMRHVVKTHDLPHRPGGPVGLPPGPR